MRQTITEGTRGLWKESAQLFSVLLNRKMVVMVLLKCAIRISISLVRISEFLYPSFSSILACPQALPRLSAQFFGKAARVEKLGRDIKGPPPPSPASLLTRSSSSRALLFKPSGEPVGRLRPLEYGVRISSKASGTADCSHKIVTWLYWNIIFRQEMRLIMFPHFEPWSCVRLPSQPRQLQGAADSWVPRRGKDKQQESMWLG